VADGPVGAGSANPGEALKYARKHVIAAVIITLAVVVLYKLINFATKGRLGAALSRIPLLGRLFASWALVLAPAALLLLTAGGAA
jgi:hypothetical protein